ncbi:MAG: hypothetical protein AAFY60_09260, partial [Myxococcota bacterium]
SIVGGFSNVHALEANTALGSDVTAADSYLADSNALIVLQGSSELRMLGETRLSDLSCVATGGTGVITDCGDLGNFPSPSTGTYTVAGSLSASFEGAVSDSANPLDTGIPGQLISPVDIRSAKSAGEFASPSTAFTPATGYPNTNGCGTGSGDCTIWSFAPREDSLALNIAPAPDALRVRTLSYGDPGGFSCEEVVVTSEAQGMNCVHTYLQGATEQLDDGIGNENGLCESGETCLYRPDAGAYLRAGSSTTIQSVSVGAVSDVRLVVDSF